MKRISPFWALEKGKKLEEKLTKRKKDRESSFSGNEDMSFVDVVIPIFFGIYYVCSVVSPVLIVIGFVILLVKVF